MKLIKLDAIDSTNDYLKEISNTKVCDNFTVVTAENQTKGRGQMGAVWNSEVGKNLIMSVLIKDFLVDINKIFDLNIAISLAVIASLKKNNIPNLSIKWPNDILSANKKIGGILIENCIKSDGTILSIVGLGLNINQTNFENLPQAASLASITKKVFDKEIVLHEIVTTMKQKVEESKHNPVLMRQKFIDTLFKKGIPMAFSNQKNKRFMGIIQGVSQMGRLEILLENNSIMEFDIKEIQMLY